MLSVFIAQKLVVSCNATLCTLSEWVIAL